MARCVTVGTIPDQVLDEVGSEVTVELGRYFHDADGGTLIFRAASSDALVVTVAVSGKTLILTPVEYGRATVRVTGEDPDGLRSVQTFGVGVSERLVRAVVEDTVAALARSHLASARMTLGRGRRRRLCGAAAARPRADLVLLLQPVIVRTRPGRRSPGRRFR